VIEHSVMGHHAEGLKEKADGKNATKALLLLRRIKY